MNVYELFFRNINPDDWELFAADFLFSIGWKILTRPSVGQDGGKDFIAEDNGQKYLVSCKHFIQSGRAVGVNDEQSITDRVTQHGANGFIGFYSTLVSSSLQQRFWALTEKGIPCPYFDKDIISNYLPKVSSLILQKYGLPNGIRFVLNVENDNYTPLPCMKCGTDILCDTMINRSLAQITLLNNELNYVYGCKRCFGGIQQDMGWIEVSQSLHQEQLNAWIRYVDNLLEKATPSHDFYKRRSEYEGKIQQRMYPSNWGQWLGW